MGIRIVHDAAAGLILDATDHKESINGHWNRTPAFRRCRAITRQIVLWAIRRAERPQDAHPPTTPGTK